MDRLMTLQLTGEAAVEFPGTAQFLDLRKSFVAELWLRLKMEDDLTFQVFGTHSDGPTARPAQTGWSLIAQKGSSGQANLFLEFVKSDKVEEDTGFPFERRELAPHRIRQSASRN